MQRLKEKNEELTKESEEHLQKYITAHKEAQKAHKAAEDAKNEVERISELHSE